jgi:hypothetical protein
MMTATAADGLIHLLCSLTASGMKARKFLPVNESLITRGRNLCVYTFLQSKCSHLLFIDADVGFDAKDVHVLLHGDFDVCVGAYPKKCYGWTVIAEAAKQGCPPEDLHKQGALFASNVLPDDKGEVNVIQKNGNRYVEVHDANTGFMLIKRAVLEKYIAYYTDKPEEYGGPLAYEVDVDAVTGRSVGTMWNVFHAGIADGTPGCGPRYLSEDYWFCRKWQAMGGKIHLSLDTKLTHSGFHTFHGDIGSMLRDVEEPPPPEPSKVKVDVEFVEPDAEQEGPKAA